MKVIIAGSRTITDPVIVDRVINRIFTSGIQPLDLEITEVVSGCAKGVDTLGENWAAANKIPAKLFPAAWKLFGVAAGPRRNKNMAEYADAAIIIWDGFSRGSMNMLGYAKQYGLATWLYNQSKNTLDHWPVPIK